MTITVIATLYLFLLAVIATLYLFLLAVIALLGGALMYVCILWIKDRHGRQ